MPAAPHCPRCNALMLSFASPEGLCPRCLMGVALGEPSELALSQPDTKALALSQPDTRALPDGAAGRAGRGLLDGLVGRVLDQKYRIERKLGQGGMGAVYLATHLGTQRPVAVKVISPALMANEEFVERFRREAHASGKLRHPNIVNVTDFGFDSVDGARLAYLVMEYLDGESLADHLARNKRPGLAWTIDVLEQVCSAVDEAHRLGIVHRDLKPANILLEPDRRGGFTVKVLDFGLAKLRDPSELRATQGGASYGRMAIPSVLGLGAPDRPEPASDAAAIAPAPDDAGPTDLTRVGAVLGTPMYMAPEQCIGKPCDARSDVYSLGLIAYEMLSGELPFAGDSAQLLRQHVERAPEPLVKRTPDLPSWIESLVMQTLEKRPGDRPQSAAVFATALRAGADGRRAVTRQALALYGEHFWTFFGVALFSGHILLALAFTLSLFSPMFAMMAMLALIVAATANAMMTVPLAARVLQGLPPFGLRESLRSWRRQGRLGGVNAGGDLLNMQTMWRFLIVVALVSFAPIDRNIPGRILMMLALCALVSGAMSSRGYMSGAVATVEGLRGREDGNNRVEELARRIKEAYGAFPPRGVKTLETLVIMSLFLAVTFGWYLVETGSWETIGGIVAWNSRRLVFLPVGSAGAGGPETSGWLTLGLAGMVLSSLVGVLLNPLVAITHALTYLKARQLGGEGIEEIARRIEET